MINCEWFQRCDIPALVASRLPKPLGIPPPNGIKFFCTADIQGLTSLAINIAQMAA
jgi:hypothetical protein